MSPARAKQRVFGTGVTCNHILPESKIFYTKGVDMATKIALAAEGRLASSRQNV